MQSPGVVAAVKGRSLRLPADASSTRAINPVGGQVRGQYLVQRRPEPGRQLLDRELDAELLLQHPQHRGEPGHGVDEGHVQVEADRELTGHA